LADQASPVTLVSVTETLPPAVPKFIQPIFSPQAYLLAESIVRSLPKLGRLPAKNNRRRQN